MVYKKIALYFLILFLVSSCKDIIPTGYTSLFNGKNLDGWQIAGTELWYVKNKELICESGPDKAYGYLSTDQKFKNFELQLDFFQELDGNSGVFFKSSIEGTKIAGWQAEVAPANHSTGGIYESYGRGWLVKPLPEKDQALKIGDWNTMKISVIDDEVITFLNGTEMIHFYDKKIEESPAGSIALQIHDGGGIRVRWKNLLIKEVL